MGFSEHGSPRISSLNFSSQTILNTRQNSSRSIRSNTRTMSILDHLRCSIRSADLRRHELGLIISFSSRSGESAAYRARPLSRHLPATGLTLRGSSGGILRAPSRNRSNEMNARSVVLGPRGEAIPTFPMFRVLIYPHVDSDKTGIRVPLQPADDSSKGRHVTSP